MKLTNETYLPPIAPLPQTTVPGNSAPLTSGNGPQTADHSKIVYGSSAGNGGGIEYPTASNEKVGAAELSGAKGASTSRRSPTRIRGGNGGNGINGNNGVNGNNGSNGGGSNSGSGTPSNKGTVGGARPGSGSQTKPKVGSAGIKDSLKNTQDISNLHNKNGFKSLSSELAANARSSLISGGVSSLVNIPLSVGEQLASKAILDRIQAQAAMPGAEKKNADGTTTTVDPAATEKQKIDARLEESEIKTETMANQIISINEGPEAKAVGKRADAPTDTSGRLGSLEKNMNGIETQMQDLGKRYGVIYTPYEAPKSSDAPTDKSRMDTIEQRYTHMNRMLKRLVKNAEADVEDS
ncbi:hypothetical protein [Pseudomonas sp. PSPC3-3]|uniref:hypothetical protein n=1 Tax=unclassified Pseudomonas TaxID=196821 RepID=UPI003CE8DEE2